MSFEQTIQRIMSGQAKGLLPSLGRSGLAAIEPIYGGVVGWRNRRFDRDPSRSRRLPKPVISIGNLTTGGTGKTPVVRWLASQLRQRGLGVAILSRGYKSKPGTLGDEQRMLLTMLGGNTRANGADRPPIVIECDPDRYAAGVRALEREPKIDLFLLDDGFQHRRLHRDLDIVLLHAAEPFGYGHVLPRGLLREPISGIQRAGAVIITNAAAVSSQGAAGAVEVLQRAYATTIAEIRRWNATWPIVFERHAPTGLRSSAVASDAVADQSLATLRERSVYCFSGLGSPGGFEAQVRSLAGRYAGQHRFPDHHDYAVADVRMLQERAVKAGAQILVTTEKDWVKLAELAEARQGGLPIWRLDVEAQFETDQEAVLLSRVMAVVGSAE